MTVLETPVRQRVRTLGVEEELLLVDAETMQPIPIAQRVLADLPLPEAGEGMPYSTLEFEAKQEQIEVVSPPLLTFGEIIETISAGRRSADLAARRVGARVVALGTATLPCRSHLVPGDRYRLMQERFGFTMDEQLTCGFHVHVGIDSDDEGVAVLDRIRPWLPVLLAISANSPFWEGTDTRFASYRYQAWSRWPSAGPYDVFGSPEKYFRDVDELLATGISLDPGMIYFDARLSTHVPTVETRIADVCLRPEDAAAVAVLTRALVETAAQEWTAGVPADDTPTSVLRLASWRASKSGVEDHLIHPQTRLPVPAAVAVRALFSHVRNYFTGPDEEEFVRAALMAILQRGSGAATQRKAMAERGRCTDVVRAAADLTLSL
jgi:carboxylate-amine ligase